MADEDGPPVPLVPYSFRSFDRQWIIPDARLINQPNPGLWESHSDDQIVITALAKVAPTSGPALSLTGLVPDLDHYKGSFGGRVFPLWADPTTTNPNLRPALLNFLAQHYGTPVSPEDLVAYIAGIAAHPGFTARFHDDLSTPGLRVPLTADASLFREVAEIGRAVVWLHTFGERMADATAGRPSGPPRLPSAQRPQIPAAGTIPSDPASMPDTIDYDGANQRLIVGKGYVDNVPSEVWRYEVSGKQVLRQWFSYRKKNRERPIIGDRRKPSALGDIQPDHWLSEYTTELINVLNVLGWLVELEPEQAALLDKVCAGPLISVEELRAANALDLPVQAKRSRRAVPGQTSLALDVT